MNQQTNSLDYLANLTRAIDFNSFESINELLVVIPCKNNANTIVKTVNELKKSGSYDFLVIDDASNDNIKEICKKEKWNFIINENQIGFNNTIRIAIDYAIENKYKYVALFPGNGLYNADDIAKMFFFAKKGYDIVTTSRFLVKNKQYKNIKKEIILSNLFYLKTHQKITDATCVMKLYNWDAMKTYSENKKITINISSIVYLVKHFKMKLIEIPTHASYNKDINENKFSMFKEIMKLIF